MNLVNKIKEIILENNYFDTLAGQRFKEWNDIKNITAVISFSGRSKNRESYPLTLWSDSDDITYVTHLYIDKWGNVKDPLGDEDTDDFSSILMPSDEPIENYDDDILREWIELLTW
jgi:hypothetical protein